jgi:UDP-glucose 4-epimerase
MRLPAAYGVRNRLPDPRWDVRSRLHPRYPTWRRPTSKRSVRSWTAVGPRYNLGNGRGFSVKEVIDAVERVTGLTVPVVIGDRRAGDPAALISDASKARDELGWRPQFAGIDEIVRTAWAWHRKTRAPE